MLALISGFINVPLQGLEPGKDLPAGAADGLVVGTGDVLLEVIVCKEENRARATRVLAGACVDSRVATSCRILVRSRSAEQWRGSERCQEIGGWENPFASLVRSWSSRTSLFDDPHEYLGEPWPTCDSRYQDSLRPSGSQIWIVLIRNLRPWPWSHFSLPRFKSSMFK